AELMDADVGFKVPMGDRAGVIAGFRETLGRIVEAPAQLAPMAEAGRRRVAVNYTWARKAERILDIYRWALRPEGPIPAPHGP
ncbi:MAG: glycosyltransferase, partial [Paracoccaceae bacterium]